jgi:hypothetical protein
MEDNVVRTVADGRGRGLPVVDPIGRRQLAPRRRHVGLHVRANELMKEHASLGFDAHAGGWS